MTTNRLYMVEKQLANRGIKDQNVLNAFRKVHREVFVPKYLKSYAYDDHPLPIDEGQTISQPFIVALMCEALQPALNKTVLEIGTGSGYQTAILAELFQHVYTIERIDSLHHKAKKALSSLGYQNITYQLGDGKDGLLNESPFDAIIVSAASKSIPEKLLAQLSNNGRLIIPIGGSFSQELKVYTNQNGTLKEDSLGGCRFVPLL